MQINGSSDVRLELDQAALDLGLDMSYRGFLPFITNLLGIAGSSFLPTGVQLSLARRGSVAPDETPRTLWLAITGIFVFSGGGDVPPTGAPATAACPVEVVPAVLSGALGKLAILGLKLETDPRSAILWEMTNSPGTSIPSTVVPSDILQFERVRMTIVLTGAFDSTSTLSGLFPGYSLPDVQASNFLPLLSPYFPIVPIVPCVAATTRVNTNRPVTRAGGSIGYTVPISPMLTGFDCFVSITPQATAVSSGILSLNVLQIYDVCKQLPLLNPAALVNVNSANVLTLGGIPPLNAEQMPSVIWTSAISPRPDAGLQLSNEFLARSYGYSVEKLFALLPGTMVDPGFTLFGTPETGHASMSVRQVPACRQTIELITTVTAGTAGTAGTTASTTNVVSTCPAAGSTVWPPYRPSSAAAPAAIPGVTVTSMAFDVKAVNRAEVGIIPAGGAYSGTRLGTNAAFFASAPMAPTGAVLVQVDLSIDISRISSQSIDSMFDVSLIIMIQLTPTAMSTSTLNFSANIDLEPTVTLSGLGRFVTFFSPILGPPLEDVVFAAIAGTASPGAGAATFFGAGAVPAIGTFAALVVSLANVLTSVARSILASTSLMSPSPLGAFMTVPLPGLPTGGGAVGVGTPVIDDLSVGIRVAPVAATMTVSSPDFRDFRVGSTGADTSTGQPFTIFYDEYVVSFHPLIDGEGSALASGGWRVQGKVVTGSSGTVTIGTDRFGFSISGNVLSLTSPFGYSGTIDVQCWVRSVAGLLCFVSGSATIVGTRRVERAPAPFEENPGIWVQLQHKLSRSRPGLLTRGDPAPKPTAVGTQIASTLPAVAPQLKQGSVQSKVVSLNPVSVSQPLSQSVITNPRLFKK